MIWTDVEQVIFLHSLIIRESGGMDGLRDRDGLEAAIAMPLLSFDGQDLYPDELSKIARLGYGRASNHAFIDGNKRIGALMTQMLLSLNGYSLHLKPDELADMFISLACGSCDYNDLLDWIKAHIG